MPGDRAAPEPGADRTRSFLARYGATILRGGIAAIPTALFTYQAVLDLSPQEAWFISYILAHKWDEDLPYPSLRRMAERTGISVRQLHRIKDAVVGKGYLQLVPRHRAEDGGQDSNAYDFGGLFGRIEELLRADGRVVVERQGAPYPEAAAPSPEPRQATAVPARPSKRGAQSQPTVSVRAARNPEPSVTPGPVTSVTPGDRTSATPGGVTLSSRRGRTLASPQPGTPPTEGPVSAKSHEKRPSQKNSKKDDSNQLSLYIMSVASDFSRELGDLEHESSNMVQANNLWHNSGLDEGAFVALMQEARAITRRAQGAEGSGRISNRMPYFFAVLRDLTARKRGEGGA